MEENKTSLIRSGFKHVSYRHGEVYAILKMRMEMMKLDFDSEIIPYEYVRARMRSIKKALRDWHVCVDDYPIPKRDVGRIELSRAYDHLCMYYACVEYHHSLPEWPNIPWILNDDDAPDDALDSSGDDVPNSSVDDIDMRESKNESTQFILIGDSIPVVSSNPRQMVDD